MIYGVGIDIVKTQRMKEAMERWGERFLGRVFTESELAYSRARKQPHLSLSVRFAAKEALIKALGKGTPVRLTDIEVKSHESGRPSISVKGDLGAFFARESISCAHVSLSHEQDYGVACVVLEGRG